MNPYSPSPIRPMQPIQPMGSPSQGRTGQSTFGFPQMRSPQPGGMREDGGTPAATQRPPGQGLGMSSWVPQRPAQGNFGPTFKLPTPAAAQQQGNGGQAAAGNANLERALTMSTGGLPGSGGRYTKSLGGGYYQTRDGQTVFDRQQWEHEQGQQSVGMGGGQQDQQMIAYARAIGRSANDPALLQIWRARQGMR